MSEIIEAIRGYAEGESLIEDTLNALRQIEPTTPEPSNPYVDDLIDDEGSYGDIATACIIYDCTVEEYELFRLALAGTRIGPKEELEEIEPQGAPEFDESFKPTLLELLGADGEDADERGDLEEGGESIIVAPMVVDPADNVPVAKHTPGGVSHEQDTHGNWADGTQGPSTGASGGRGATLTQAGAQTAPTPSDADARPAGRGDRPMLLADLSGQSRVRDRLRLMVDAAQKDGRRLDHIMFSGPPGLGKTTMAKALANEMGANLKIVTGPALSSRESLVEVIMSMEDGDILFIDEIHALPTAIDEMLFPALEDGVMDVDLAGRGTVRVDIPDITFLGATTNPEGVAKPLRDRFGSIERLSYYKDSELAEIVQRTASGRGMEFSNDVALSIASRSRGTPRIANRLVRRVNDFVTARGGGFTINTVDKVLNMWDIDPSGLTSEDRRVMGSLRDLGTAGINTLSASTGLDATTISSVVEPYLLRQGFIQRTPRGRQITEIGRMHLETYGTDDLSEFGKSEDMVFSAPIEIAKADKRQNLVFGWANVTFKDGNQVIDHQGHMIDVDELESAAYNFSVKYRKTGDSHSGEGFGELVESLIVTQDKIEKGGFPDEMLGKWWIGFRVPDEDWDRVESGERSMFSIQGKARLEEV